MPTAICATKRAPTGWCGSQPFNANRQTPDQLLPGVEVMPKLEEGVQARHPRTRPGGQSTPPAPAVPGGQKLQQGGDGRWRMLHGHRPAVRLPPRSAPAFRNKEKAMGAAANGRRLHVIRPGSKGGPRRSRDIPAKRSSSDAWWQQDARANLCVSPRSDGSRMAYGRGNHRIGRVMDGDLDPVASPIVVCQPGVVGEIASPNVAGFEPCRIPRKPLNQY